MRETASSIGRNRLQRRFSAQEPRVAFSVCGRWEQVLAAVPIIDTNTEQPVDLWVLPECRPIKEFLESQPCIHQVYFSPVNTNGLSCCENPPPFLPVYGRYRDVIPLNVIHRAINNEPLDHSYLQRVALANGLRPPSPGFRFRW